jgi:predicted ATPase
LITEIEVKNFKTLRDVKIPLAPGITVMVGANNSGKSNALAVLKLLAESLRQRDAGLAVAALGGIDSIRSRDATGKVEIKLAATFGQWDFDHRLVGEQDPDRQWRWNNTLEIEGPDADQEDKAALRLKRLSQLRFEIFLMSTAVHDLSVSALRAPAVIQRGARLGPDGRDVAAVIDSLAGESPALRDAIDDTVRRAAHEVKRVVTRPGPQPGTKVLGIEEKDGRVYGAEDMSDGLLLFIGLAVAAQLKVETPSILAIEEPERGIHPRRLRDLVDHLLRLTKSGVQVVLTTHSPTLLDEFRDSPESVLIFDRNDKGTHITRLSDRPDWAKELKGAPLGELWYSGVLGGVPGR